MKHGRSCDGPPALRWSLREPSRRCRGYNEAQPELRRAAGATLEHGRTGVGAAMAGHHAAVAAELRMLRGMNPVRECGRAMRNSRGPTRRL